MYNLLKADLSHLVLAPPEQIGGKARKAVSELLHPTIPSPTCTRVIGTSPSSNSTYPYFDGSEVGLQWVAGLSVQARAMGGRRYRDSRRCWCT
jgi:hypothetical protein